MIYITGDTHGEESRFESFDSIIEQTLTEDDKVIVGGDFGYISDDSYMERLFLRRLTEKPYQILWVDGNHENFTLINEYPVEEWCGGKAHIIRRDKKGNPKIIHLMRGQVFTIENKKIFTMGGAYSRDKYMRTPYYSWWPEEMPTDEEMKEAIHNLNKHNNTVDYIVTHTGPEYVSNRLYGNPEIKEKPLNNFLEWVRENVTYKHWYMGHHHVEMDITSEMTILWFQLRNIETNEIMK